MARLYRQPIFWVLLAAFVVRMGLLTAYGADQNFTYDDDSLGYVTLAENIHEGHGFSVHQEAPYIPESIRTPGYPVFLWLHKAVFGTYTVALVMQALLITLIGYILFRLSGSIWPSLVFSFMPFSLLASLRYVPQALFVFIITFAVWQWLRVLETQRLRYVIVSGLLVGMAALVRPIAFLLYIPFVISLLVSMRPWRLAVRYAAVFVLIFYLTISPWLLRNKAMFGEAGLSSQTGLQLYFYDTSHVYAIAKHISFGAAQDYLILHAGIFQNNSRSNDDYGTFPISHALEHKAFGYFLMYPFSFIVARAKEVFAFFTRDGIRYWFEYFGVRGSGLGLSNLRFTLAVLIERTALLGILGAALVGAWKTMHTRRALMVISILVVAYLALLSGSVSSAGFRFAAEPLILLVAYEGIQTRRTL